MSEPPTSPTEAARPKARRNISFAHVNWTPRGGTNPRSSSRSRPSGGLRSISFAHPQRSRHATAPVRPGTATGAGRPGVPPRALSFCDTRFTPSGPNLALRQGSVSGPFAFLNPTTAIFDIRTDDGLSEAGEGGGERARIRWNAREFRKGRHIFVLPRAAPLAHRLRNTSKLKRVLLGIWRMVTVFPYWDVSWLIGVCFTVGCALFIACGLFYWLPIAYPETEFAHEEDVAGGIVSFVGATLFQVGAVLLMLESWNDRAETKFGGAVEAFFGERFSFRRGARRGRVSHDKDEEGSGAGLGGDEESGPAAGPPVPARTEGEARGRRGGAGDPFGEREWQWLPSWHDVRTHYIYEIGFLASATMSLGATIFYLCGILALPGIHLSQAAKWGAYYLPYLVGGILFALASLLYVLETQPDWHTPQPRKIGWHVGVFNLIGGVGWTLAAAFGYCGGAQHWCAYQSELSLIWASVAFTFGSALQWYESLDKYVFVIED
ncbi:integral membrane protein [Cordyceps fumosorosea ARSEF 2679]|uniref:Integral membrane protein n=1 Tax=Cordyceps fumosorosea (strain ARSEF 2679) TaxID=1081104 RepID=A0A167NCY4_CORFA|nr:integral membrane protein [Cordyceps fumosorosea ARSEF 2679]OAA55409.1 integral membrane protein [Cordyceps fumosorosea ARSEF 2679]